MTYLEMFLNKHKNKEILITTTDDLRVKFTLQSAGGGFCFVKDRYEVRTLIDLKLVESVEVLE